MEVRAKGINPKSHGGNMTRKEALVLLNKHAYLLREKQTMFDETATKCVVEAQILVVEQLMVELNIGWAELKASYEKRRLGTHLESGTH